MNNKLDTFNKDKRKCQKCKEYFDAPRWSCLCEDCYIKWAIAAHKHLCSIEDWCNSEQTWLFQQR